MSSIAGSALQASLLENGQGTPEPDQVPASRSHFTPARVVGAVAVCGLLACALVLSPARQTMDPVSSVQLSRGPFVPNSPSHAPPLFRIVAQGPLDAGLQHGRLARARIQGWFASAEMQSIFAWVAGNGSAAFAQLKRDNAAEFPAYVDEMRGIAEGSGTSLDQVWVANLIMELENLMTMEKVPSNRIAAPKKPDTRKGCSDEYVVSAAGYAGGFAHGHNDDWSPVARQYFYFLSVAGASEAAGLDTCAGLTYPGTLVGWSPTWNPHGMWSTQNTLLPRRSRAGSLGDVFVQKRAVCRARGLDEAVAGLTRGGWSDGASMNVVDRHGGRMANIELWEDMHSVLEVTTAMGNYSHFNEYKHLQKLSGRPIDDPRLFVRDLRQAEVDSLPAPRSDRDIMARLSNSVVYSPTGTLVTMVLNGTTGRLNVWCCGVSAMSKPNSPVYSWDLNSFFL